MSLFRYAIRDAVRELEAEHYPEEDSRRKTCVTCAPQNCDWPCGAKMVAEDLKKLL